MNQFKNKVKVASMALLVIFPAFVGILVYREAIFLTPFERAKLADERGEVLNCGALLSLDFSRNSGTDIHAFEKSQNYKFAQCRDYIDTRFAGTCHMIAKYPSDYKQHTNPSTSPYDLSQCEKILPYVIDLMTKDNQMFFLIGPNDYVRVNSDEIKYQDIIRVLNPVPRSSLAYYEARFNVELPQIFEVDIVTSEKTFPVMFEQLESALKFKAQVESKLSSEDI